MIKYILTGLCFLCLLNISAYADPIRKPPGKYKQEMGLGLGALIGGLVGGPPGAIVGTAGGAWFGTRDDKKDKDMLTVENRLLEKESELVSLQDEFDKMKEAYGREFRKVTLERNSSALEALTRGIFLNVYFRTDSDEIDPAASQYISRRVTIHLTIDTQT